MKPIFEVHPIQGKILKVLLFQTTARFSQLNPDKVSTDQFNFHLKALINADLLQKKDGGYILTNKGKEFANRFDTENIVIERQAKLTLAVVPVKIVGRQKYYLIHQRLKQPNFGYYGSVNGKIRWGEKVFDAAKRELLEETGLVAEKMSMVGIYHKTNYSSGKELLEDMYFFRIRVDKFSGKLFDASLEGKNFWATRAEIARLNPRFPEMIEALSYYDQDEVSFTEKSYVAEGY